MHDIYLETKLKTIHKMGSCLTTNYNNKQSFVSMMFPKNYKKKLEEKYTCSLCNKTFNLCVREYNNKFAYHMTYLGREMGHLFEKQGENCDRGMNYMLNYVKIHHCCNCSDEKFSTDYRVHFEPETPFTHEYKVILKHECNCKKND